MAEYELGEVIATRKFSVVGESMPVLVEVGHKPFRKATSFACSG